MEELSLEAQEVLVHALAAPGILERGSRGAEIVETHISWVLLTEHYAFKFKKALDLGFLDYSSLAKRRHFCQEELRLNRRTAPQLYLDVVAVGGTCRAPRAGGEPAIEYAVKMRRFPREGLLERWALEHRLHPAHVDLIAAEVARFHRAIPAAGADSRYGRPETLLHPVMENFEQLRESLDDPQRRTWVDAQEAWVLGEHRRLHPTFEQRLRDGFVRECHGDLHLGNLAEVEGRIVPFDCIEFNPALRWIDVMSELAFLLMDLEHRGERALAARLLDRYLQHTGDFAGIALLRFYKHYRAMVRAKVTLIRLSQGDLSQAERLRHIEEFGAYLTLAGSYARAPEPRLILTFGPSGCGKTYVTDQLLAPLDAVRLRSDVERKRLFGLAPEAASRSQIDAGIYTREATERTYRHLRELAATVLSSGYACIVDATFLRHEQRAPFFNLAKALNVPLRILAFQTDRSVLEQRITARAQAGSDASEANLSVLARQLESVDALTEQERERSIIVESGKPISPNELAEQILLDIQA